MSTKKLAFAAIAAGLALSLAACAPQSGSTATSDTAKSSKIVYAIPSSWVKAGALQDNIKAYEKESGNTVEVLGIPDEQYDSTVQARLTSGSGIDVFAGLDSIEKPGSVMIEITNPSFKSRMNESVYNSMLAVDGKLYSYPTADGLATFGVLYNKSVFEAAGVTKAPTTLDELTEDFKKVKASGVDPLYLAGKDGWTLLQHRNAADADFVGGNKDVATELATNKTTWAKVPGFDKQYQALSDWAKGGLLNADALTGSYEQSTAAVASGKAGAIINGTWAIGAIRAANADVKLGFFALPNVGADNVVALSKPNTMHIAASSKVQKQAAELLDFLIQPARATAFLDAAPGVPGFKDAKATKADSAITDVLGYVDAGKVVGHFDNLSRFPTPQDDTIAAYQELIAGRIDVAEFTKRYDSAWTNAGKTAGIAGF
ncbi:MAG TPA: extracellular solute-binding protein [Candidatus Lumbricidophila sp.]|nr:extracellular solute-binding protein [Candidatus Lumbricidophila sp.]